MNLKKKFYNLVSIEKECHPPNVFIYEIYEIFSISVQIFSHSDEIIVILIKDDSHY